MVGAQAHVMERPGSARALFVAGVEHHQAGRLQEAERHYRQALAVDAHHSDSMHLLGVVASVGGRSDVAAGLIRAAIALNPSVAAFHSNLGNALQGQGLLTDALAAYDEAIRLSPHLADAHYNRGRAFRAMKRLDEAICCYRTALKFNPRYVEAYLNLGAVLKQQNRLKEAIECYRAAIALHPNCADAHQNLGIILLTLGDLPAGFAEYEWRWQTEVLRDVRRGFAEPQWQGESAPGATLLVHTEQGFGDTIQFCRYAALAEARGLHVVIEAPKPLVRLLRSLSGTAHVIAAGDPAPRYDYHCPLLSLPLACGTDLATIPSAPSYLQADPAQVTHWASRLALLGRPGCRVGLVWAGNPALGTDERRSLPLHCLAPVLAVPGLQFFSLQQDARPDPRLIDYMSEMHDFADSAALIANLDLVIAADTAVAHLAAALGKPVWLLDRFDACWRWLMGRLDSPWYPSLRIYRQAQPGQWGSVVEEVARNLIAFPSRLSDTCPSGLL